MKIGLVLSGGGAHGIAHTVVLSIFDELGIKPHLISGTSAGAIVGTLYSAGYTAKEIQEIFLSLGIIQRARLLGLSFGSFGMLKSDPIAAYVQNFVRYEKLEQLPIPMRIVATDATDFGKKETFVFKEGSIQRAIQASVSIPGIFEPVAFGNKTLVDGGVTDPLPVDVIYEECDKIIAVDLTKGRCGGKKGKIAMIREMIGNFSYLPPDSKKTISAYEIDCLCDFEITEYSMLEFNKLKEILEIAEQKRNHFKDRIAQSLYENSVVECQRD